MRALLPLLLLACGAPEAPQPKPATPPSEAAPAVAEAPPAAPAAAQAAAAPAAAYAALGVESAWAGEADWAAHEAEFQGAVALGKVLDDPAAHAGAVVIEGKVSDVCQKKGCWTVLSDGARTLRITMKDHAFGIPKDASGATAQFKGELVAKPLDPKTVAHYASEAGNPDAMPEKGLPAGATETWELVASSARLKR
jgi:hypothetical protein